MAEIKIRFDMNLDTGKKDIVIEYEDDGSMLPREHEKKHQQIVEKLLGKGILRPDEVGGVKVTRIRPGRVDDAGGSQADRERQRLR